MEPQTILQPSMHTLEEYADLVRAEAAARGVTLFPVDYSSDPEAVTWATDKALDAIRDAGYYVVEEDDSLLIFPEGYEPTDITAQAEADLREEIQGPGPRAGLILRR